MPARRAHVVIEGRRRRCQSADFGISIATESWDNEAKAWKGGLEHAEARYSLRVKVDEHSGEDGAAAPEVEDIPVARAAGGRHPSLEELGALTVEEIDDGHDWDEWEAWFGNDAPSLFGNVVRFLGWDGPHLRVRWDARYEEDGENKPLVFEGPAVFTGIHLSVRPGEDPDAYVTRAWGGQPVESLDRHFLGRADYGPRMGERRYSESYVYVPKGMARPDYWKPGDWTAPEPDETPAPSLPPAPPKPKAIAPVAAGRLADRDGRFSLELPEGWERFEDPVLEKLGGLSLRVAGADRDVVLKAVAVQRFGGLTLADYVDNSLGAYQAIWTVEERAADELSGAPAVRLVLLQRSPAQPGRLLKYYAGDGAWTVVLTFLTAPEAFEGHRPGFAAIARSLRLVE